MLTATLFLVAGNQRQSGCQSLRKDIHTQEASAVSPCLFPPLSGGRKHIFCILLRLGVNPWQNTRKRNIWLEFRRPLADLAVRNSPVQTLLLFPPSTWLKWRKSQNGIHAFQVVEDGGAWVPESLLDGKSPNLEHPLQAVILVSTSLTNLMLC